MSHFNYISSNTSAYFPKCIAMYISVLHINLRFHSQTILHFDLHSKLPFNKKHATTLLRFTYKPHDKNNCLNFFETTQHNKNTVVGHIS